MKPILILVMILLVANTGHSSEVLKIGISDSPPQEYIDDKNNVSGMSSEIVISTLKLMKFNDYTIEIYPWIRATKLLDSGEINALYTIIKNEERIEKYYYPEESLYHIKSVFFVRKGDEDNFKFNTSADLKGKRMGIVRGYAFPAMLAEYLSDPNNYEESPRESYNFKKLASGRIDCIFSLYSTGIYQAQQLGLEDKIVAIADNAIEEHPVYIAFSKKSTSKEFANH
jgi:polar amino acid transport system substrate-binding protein